MLLAFAAAPSSTESAIANGDTRTILFSNSHTNESGSFTYKLNGYYDPATLDKLNWFMRDWRLNEPTKMDPKLFDILWEVYRQSGSTEPIDVLSAYRSPHTNAMLRRRSRLVAEHSQHMEGKAIDAHFVDVSTATIRDITMRMQAGGVGFYPVGSTPWVHVDSGSVRYWPRMSRDALARLFPDGKTVFIPSDGEPMPGYDLARAEIEARGGDVVTASSAGSSLLGWLFGGPRGGGGDDAEEGGAENVVMSGRGGFHAASQVVIATSDNVASARRNLPRGQTFMQPASTEAAPPAKPEVVATADTDTASDSGPVTLHGPIAAQFIAPLPPRKPSDLMADIVVTTPVPPPRPAEFAVASTLSKPVPAPVANSDLIAALLERGKLPGEITRGVHMGSSSALALVDTNAPPESTERPGPGPLARAAALALPPLPPPRPRAPAAAKPQPSGTSSAARTPPPEAPTRFAVHGSVSTSPYGELVVDAFNSAGATSNPNTTTFANGLRGTGQ